MAFKKFALNDSQTVVIYKRRSSRNLRLSVTSTGQIRVTIPLWAPYRSGLDFARSRQQWIDDHYQPATRAIHGQSVGKAHHLRFIPDDSIVKPTSRVTNNEVIIRHPVHVTSHDPSIQKLAISAGSRALRNQAEQLLPQRLKSLADQHGFQYKSVSVRQLKSRWGSCDHKQHIVLSIYLMQLPWNLIDYVLLHELTHTKIMQHGPGFWEAMERVLPNAKQRRKEIKKYQPIFSSAASPSMA